MHYIYLFIAIVAEVFATTALKASKSFTVLWPSVVVVVGYGTAFYFLSRCQQRIGVGAAYAIWSGVGMVLITVAGAIVYKQHPDAWSIIGMALIIAGVVVMTTLSNSVVQ